MPGEMLDEYLRKGWYRIGQTIITTDLIVKDDFLIPVFWMRIDLKKYYPGRAAVRITGKNSNYTAAVKPFEINDEIEELYTAYKIGIDFTVPDSVSKYLLGDKTYNVFDTLLIEVRDSGRLIAAGFFDNGKESTTGILHFYHHDYKKQSLGKYLMLFEIDYSIRNNKNFYYPGYISPETTKYDYKLFPGKNASELYLRKNDEWFPYLSVYDRIMEWSATVTKVINADMAVKNEINLT